MQEYRKGIYNEDEDNDEDNDDNGDEVHIMFESQSITKKFDIHS